MADACAPCTVMLLAGMHRNLAESAPACMTVGCCGRARGHMWSGRPPAHDAASLSCFRAAGVRLQSPSTQAEHSPHLPPSWHAACASQATRIARCWRSAALARGSSPPWRALWAPGACCRLRVCCLQLQAHVACGRVQRSAFPLHGTGHGWAARALLQCRVPVSVDDSLAYTGMMLGGDRGLIMPAPALALQVLRRAVDEHSGHLAVEQADANERVRAYILP